MTDLKQLAENVISECGYEIVDAPFGWPVPLRDGKQKVMPQQVFARGSSEEDAADEFVKLLKMFIPQLPAGTSLLWRQVPERGYERNIVDGDYWYVKCRFILIQPSEGEA